MMKREMDITLGGENYTLVVGWRASVDISERVFDPLMASQDVAIASQLQSKGIPYTPRFEVGINETVAILHCALKASGYDLTLDDVGEAVIADGAVVHVESAWKFLGALVQNGSKEVKSGKKGK